MENKILVAYVGVRGIRAEDIDSFVHRVVAKIIPTTFEGEIIIIPVQLFDTKIECINPKYIIEESLVKEHTELIKHLNQELHNQLNILKEQNKNE